MGEIGFEEFVAGRGPALLRFAYVLTQDAGLAEDLVQDALFDAFRRWHRVTGADHPEAYVRRMMVNRFVSRRRLRSSGEVPGPVPETRVDDAADAVIVQQSVRAVLAGLARRQRAVLVLRYYLGWSDAEIGAALGCAEGTVRSLAARAFAILRERLGPELGRGVEDTQGPPEQCDRTTDEGVPL